MKYTQLVEPDLNTVGNVGWCLSFTEDAFHTPHLSTTATDAWNATEFPHAGIPNACVPIWFSYYEGGVNYGHVAVYVPGSGILSSPYKKNGTQQWFSSIEECERILHCAYLGWSEDLATVRIIKPEEEQEMIDRTGAILLWLLLRPNVAPTEDQINSIIGMHYIDWLQSANAELQVRNADILSTSAQLTAADQQIEALKSQVANAPIVITHAITDATKAAPVATKAPWYVKFLKALGAK